MFCHTTYIVVFVLGFTHGVLGEVVNTSVLHQGGKHIEETQEQEDVQSRGVGHLRDPTSSCDGYGTRRQ